MANFKPQITLKTAESISNYKNSSPYALSSAYKVIQYSTYRELKKNLKKHLEESYEPYVSVLRSRRGEWGERFEHWQMVNGKPTIIKEGWN